MSGGSHDYLCFKMQDAAKELMKKDQPIARRAFGGLLIQCAKAMHDIEWVDSSDMGEGEDVLAIMACICHKDMLRIVVEDAEALIEELKRLITEAKAHNEQI